MWIVLSEKQVDFIHASKDEKRERKKERKGESEWLLRIEYIRLEQS